jgi:uncharacterized Zn finger protein (UPF0148 family)
MEETKTNGNIEEETTSQIPAEKKLADLMMRGWTMLEQSCPVETCRCPLMKNQLGQKYCVGCEMWHIEHERPVKQRFDLVSMHGKQMVEVKNNHQELTKVTKPLDFAFCVNKQLIQSLQVKLIWLSSILNTETDLERTQSILENIQKCIENIKIAKTLT